MKAYLKSQPAAARLGEAQHRRHRLSPGRSRTSSSTSARRSPRGSWRSSRGENHFDKRVTVTTPLQKAGAYLRHRQDGRRQHQPHHPLGRRHGDRQEAARRQDLLLRGRRRHRQAGRQGQRRVLRLAADLPRQAAAARSRSPSSSPSSPTPTARSSPDREHAAAGLPVARSPPGPPKGRFAYLGFTGVWYGHCYDAGVQRRPRSSRSPTGPSIGPTRRCKYKFWVRHAKYDQADTSDFAGPDVHRRDPQSQGREGRSRSNARPTPTAASTASTTLPGRRHAGRLSADHRRTTAAAASASRSTRSPSSR